VNGLVNGGHWLYVVTLMEDSMDYINFTYTATSIMILE